MALTRRKLDVTFSLGKGSFGEDGSDTATLKDLRMSATILKTGGVSMSTLTLRVYGMPLDIMNKLSVLGTLIAQGNVRLNQITLLADRAVVFNGVISQCWVDAANQPDVSLVVIAQTGLLDQMKPVAPISYKGTVDAATVVAGIAAGMVPPRSLENSGVKVQIASPYLTGTAIEQLRSVARAGDFYCMIDDQPGPVVAIWPRGGSRGGEIPVISKTTGMVGYPAHTDTAIQVTTLFNPALIYGQNVKVESELTPANGSWQIVGVAHELESETPNGKWFTTVQLSILGFSPTVVASTGQAG